MHPIESCVRNPVKVSVGVLIVALFGAIGLLRMPMQLTPEVQIPTITVETRWPGASPQEIEREIVQEQEEQLQSVEGVTKMSSESLDSQGRIILEFNVGTNMEEALLKVNSRLQQVPEYPEDADEPVISTSDASERPIAWFILSLRMPTSEMLREFMRQHPERAADLETVLNVENPALAQLRLRRLAALHADLQPLLPAEIDIPTLRKFCEDQIETQFERVAGVSNANVTGGRDPELQVIVDPQKLAARQLTIQDVRLALRAENKDTSGGDFWEGKRRYVVRTMGQFRSPEQVADTILAVHEGAPVYVRDVGEVRLDFKKPDGFVRRFGSSNIAINAQRETGANVLDVMQGLRDTTQRLNDTVLKDRGLILYQVYDETEYIYSAVGLVNENIVVGGLLTIVVLIVFLRSARSTLVISLAIPTSIIGTFLILSWLGRSLNVISLAGLAFAVGMLVDNAVVVLENIFRHYQLGKSPYEAAVYGTQEVWGAVVASTLTTLAVFLPVLFIQEEAGQLFRDIALAISAAVGLSMIVSITVIPTAAARLLRGEQRRQEQSRTNWLRWLDDLGHAFAALVAALNNWTFRTLPRRLMLVGVMLLLSIGLSYWFWPKVEYLPTGNRNLVIGLVLPPPGYNIEELTAIGQTVENELQAYWDLDPGSPEAKKLPYPAIADFFYVARGRQVFVGLRAADPLRAGELVPLVFSLRNKLPGSIVVASQTSLFERGLTAGRTIDIEISGPDLTQLVGYGGRIMGQVMQLQWRPEGSTGPDAQVRPVPSLDLSSPEVHIEPRLMQASEMGVTASDLGYTVDALVDGAYATDYYVGNDKIDLVILGNTEFAARTQDLTGLPLSTPTGELVPLSAVANIQISSGPEQVNHRERQRAVTIQVTPPPDIALEKAIERINAEILEPLRTSGELSAAYTITLSGTADKLMQTWLSFRWVMLLALLVTYLLMAALFESWIHPLVIMLSVPLGAVGGVLGLALLSYYQAFTTFALGWPPVTPPTLDVLTMLGFVILIGTVVNNPILIVHQSLNYIYHEGMSDREAILESVRTRIRPIFMTTTTTVFGLAPLVLFRGAGSELYRGLGSVVLGGLIMSTLFTLVLVPVMFSLMLDLQRWMVPRRRERVDVEPLEVAEVI
jgi:HAE1 family hydrophobic/amphiphilic exporter-1